ncbi:MAG: pyruvate carboxylase subunit B [Candidatus Latescibacteria bacterium]|nr:pyruvate carboxylase subunit B [bacterium]MBD3423286.1 pyruvate carboxylase subunit B [Candidatus Latescibacterota bacterium]
MNSDIEGKGSKEPVKITDTTFRDGHQSTLATRFRTDDMLEIADRMNQVGFHSMEVWGGATFDVATRYLNEDPWERLEKLKKKLPDTPLQMLLRGQNLVGYRNYADDVVERFVEEAASAGIDIFRVFDALNDTRNFEASFKAIKKTGKHIQGTICYSLTENRLGGDVFNLDYYREKAAAIQDMGADSLCIKDMAGLLNPFDSYKLISALKEAVSIPIQLHCHYTSGMASMAYLKAIEAGVDIIDCALAPFALRSSQPSVESILATLQETGRDPGLDMENLFAIGSYIEEIAPKYCCYLNTTKMSIIDTGVIKHQVPGGMLTNLVSQLREQDALDRIDDVFEELPRTRKELGYPPLVTPTSQIVGIQAVQNVLFGRYKMITGQVKDYAYGLYGKPPIPIDRKVQKKALKDYPRGDKPIEHRPADILEPELEKARELSNGIARNERDVLICALYPTTGLRFLRWKYGLEEVPDEVKPKSLEEIRKQEELIDKIKSGDYDPSAVRRKKSQNARSFNVYVGDESFNVEVEEVRERVRFKAAGDTEPIIKKKPKEKKKKKSKSESGKESAGAEGEFTLNAPMPGMVIEYRVEEGDQVAVGDVLLILEAMKMQNSITSNVNGVVKSIKIAPGNSVEKNQVIMIIAQ